MLQLITFYSILNITDHVEACSVKGAADGSMTTTWAETLDTSSAVAVQAQWYTSGQHALNWWYTTMQHNKRVCFSHFPFISSLPPSPQFLTPGSQRFESSSAAVTNRWSARKWWSVEKFGHYLQFLCLLYSFIILWRARCGLTKSTEEGRCVATD
jgi:hypothetical protein